MYNQILAEGLRMGALTVTVSPEAKQWVENRCAQALEQIRMILSDGALDDEQCFEKIEGVVAVFEEMGSDGGGRHDFG